MTDRFGLVAGRYLLRDQLGHGGMGRVWLARDEMLDRDVAVKEVAPPTAVSEEEAEHLRILIHREARAAARINHPNVVKIYDVIRTEEWPWLVMEYIPSMTLQKVVEYDGPMAPVEVAKIGIAVLDALVAAHDAGVLHRDVKPDNVLLCDDGRVVLSDFGLASLDTDGTVTRTGQLGTPQYVAPERARHGTSSREADMWSLGATLYAAVEGRSPYGRPTVLETLSALAVDEPDPMRLAGPLTPLIVGLLRRDPEQRLRAGQAADMLRRVAAGQTIEEIPVKPARGRAAQVTQPLSGAHTPRDLTGGRPGRPRRFWRTVVIGAGALGVTAVAGILLSSADLGTTPVPPTESSSAAIPPAPGIAACEAPARQAQTVQKGSPPPGREEVLLPGWSWFTDPGKFIVGVPPNFVFWRVGSTTCFRDPYGMRVMGVVEGAFPAQELPGFTEVAKESVYHVGPQMSTEWEFAYQGAERSRHAVALMNGPLTVFYATDEEAFSQLYQEYGAVKVSFRPAPPARD